MNKLSRRSFGKKLIATGTIPLLKPSLLVGQTAGPAAPVPDAIAGYELSPDDKPLVAKFLQDHEKNMTPLRERDLPNGIPPCFIFRSPKEHRATEIN